MCFFFFTGGYLPGISIPGFLTYKLSTVQIIVYVVHIIYKDKNFYFFSSVLLRRIQRSRRQFFLKSNMLHNIVLKYQTSILTEENEFKIKIQGKEHLRKLVYKIGRNQIKKLLNSVKCMYRII